MDGKIEELIAFGASYALNCRPCMDYHRGKAAKAGVTEEEMRAAVGIAEAVKAGAGKSSREYVESIIGEVAEVATDRCCPAGTACCS